jgi:hypothetical protein
MRFRNFIAFCVIAAGSCFAVQTFGQTIITGPVPNSLCPGDTVYVPFTATGTFQLQNAFTAQIANPNGRFDSSFARLGATTDPNATYVTGIVPSSTAPGTHYRIRVISTLPDIDGSDNGSDVSIGAVIKPDYSINQISPTDNIFAALTDMPVSFINESIGGNGTYLWNFGDGASPATSTNYTPEPVTYSTPGSKIVTLTATSIGGCVSTDKPPYTKLSIYSRYPAIPHSAVIDSINTVDNQPNDTIWVVSGASYSPSGVHQIIFVEPGGNVNLNGSSEVVYLKKDATCSVSSGNGCVIIYVDSTGITYTSNDPGVKENFALLLCPTLKFNYANAPTYDLLGVHESATAPINISLYPNPANDMLHVFTGATIPSSVRLFNTIGEGVWSAAGHVTNSVQIATDNLQNGMYYLQVVAPGKMSTEKVTVIH